MLSSVNNLSLFLHTFFTCTKFNSIILLYEQNTSNIATEVLAISKSPFLLHIVWITINLDEVSNIKQNDSDAKDEDIDLGPNNYIDPLSFFLTIIDGPNLPMKLNDSRTRFPEFSQICSNFIITREHPDDMILNAIYDIAYPLKMVNLAVLLLNENSQLFEVLKLRYDIRSAIAIDIHAFNCERLSDTLFYEKYIDFYGKTISVYLLFEPPRAINLTGHLPGNSTDMYFAGGREAYFGTLFENCLHTKTEFFTSKNSKRFIDNKDQYLFLLEFLEKPYAEDKYEPKHLEYAISDNLLEFGINRTLIILESQVHRRKIWTNFYPHEFENYVIVVPNELRETSTFIQSILNFPLLNVWAISILLFTISRKAVRVARRMQENNLEELFFNTFGLSFGSTSPTNVRTRPEQILVLFLSIFSMLAGMLCSGFLFQQFATTMVSPSINSLADLAQRPYLDVWIPIMFDDYTEDWLRAQMNNHMERLDKFLILAMIYAKNTSAAYITPESLTNIMLQREDMLRPDGQSFFHILKLNVLSQHVSFGVKDWWFVDRLNLLLRHAIEYGLMQYYETRTKRILKLITYDTGSTKINLSTISLKDLEFVFIIYLMGVTLGACVFTCEIIILRYQKGKKFWK